MKVWWERWPGRLDRELADLREAGIRFTLDEGAKTRGKIILAMEHQLDGQSFKLEARFPDTYPKTKPEVIAPDLSLRRHQNPFGKNLCLIGRATRNWDSHMTLARLIVEQLPKVLKIGRAEDPTQFRAEEEPQGEPFTTHYPYVAECTLLVDSAWVLDPSVQKGTLEIALEPGHAEVWGAILRVSGDGTNLAQADQAILERFAGRPVAKGRWVRWDAPIAESDPDAFLRVLANKYPELKTPRLVVGKKAPAVDVIGVVFPEEVEQGRYSDAWIFLVRINNGKGLVRASRAGRADLAGRSPELKPLAGKSVSIIGLGSLGAASAIEFARAGAGELRIADFDFVEAGTVSRWPLGLSAAGRDKARLLEQFIRSNYPYTRIKAFQSQVGGALQPEGHDDLGTIDDLLDVDLVYDATAEIGVQDILSALAFEKGKPYICISATSGAWGGVIARLRPGKTGCWMCLQRAIDEKRIPPAPMNVSGDVQVPGCASPTFTGAGVDCSIVALAAVKLALGTLCAEDNGYPDVDWDVAVIELRGTRGEAIAPKWNPFSLPRDSNCRSCL